MKTQRIYGIASTDSIYLKRNTFTLNKGNSVRTVALSVEVSGELLTTQLDHYHLRELRLAVQRAERWIKEDTP